MIIVQVLQGINSLRLSRGTRCGHCGKLTWTIMVYHHLYDSCDHFRKLIKLQLFVKRSCEALIEVLWQFVWISLHEP